MYVQREPGMEGKSAREFLIEAWPQFPQWLAYDGVPELLQRVAGGERK
jgi:hypothetical protein